MFSVASESVVPHGRLRYVLHRGMRRVAIVALVGFTVAISFALVAALRRRHGRPAAPATV